jgi:hypothetical protein
MNQNQQRTRVVDSNLKYAVDVVLCIDATESMGPALSNVKHSALTFPNRLAQEMVAKGLGISSLRLKVIAFRDYADHADDAMTESPFFRVPEDLVEFESAVRGLRPIGGGDIPESGLEALALALGSDWETGLDKRRHVIVMFTDAPAHRLGDPRHTRVPTYPRSVPTSLEALFEQWGSGHSRDALMENSAKRLLMFAPEQYPWADIADDWNNTIFFPSEAGEGLEEWEMDQIIATIANSL